MQGQAGLELMPPPERPIPYVIKGWGAHRHLALGTQCLYSFLLSTWAGRQGETDCRPWAWLFQGPHGPLGPWATAAYMGWASRQRDLRDTGRYTRVGWGKRGGGDPKCQEQGLGPPQPPPH